MSKKIKIKDLTIGQFGDILYEGYSAKESDDKDKKIKVSNMQALLNAPKGKERSWKYFRSHCFEMLFPFYGIYKALMGQKITEDFIGELCSLAKDAGCDKDNPEYEFDPDKIADNFTKKGNESSDGNKSHEEIWKEWFDDLVADGQVTLDTKLNETYDYLEKELQIEGVYTEGARFSTFTPWFLVREMISAEVKLYDDITSIKLLEYIDQNISQIVLTGAPGTGKTRAAKNVAEYRGKELSWKGEDDSHPRYEFVQFHPSYDYTDFVEGLRPVEIDGQVTFKKIDGIFKKFCRKVVDEGDPKEKYFG